VSDVRATNDELRITGKEKRMSSTQVAYTEEQIDYIKRVLVSNSQTITFLLLSLAKNDIDVPPCTSADEIATCLRILSTEAQYV
jgi:hypothetical protein